MIRIVEARTISAPQNKPEFFVPEPWFKGYLKGNALWPQRYTPGIRIVVGAAVLRNPPADWMEFTESKLSDEQLERLGIAMSNMHHKENVAHSIESAAKKGDKKVSYTDLQSLWSTTKNHVCSLILRGAVQYPTMSLNMLFNNPGNPETVGRTQQMIWSAEEALLSPEGQVLSELYKTRIMADYRRNYPADLAEKEAKYRAEYPLTKEDLLELANTLIAERLVQISEGQDVFWIFPSPS